MAQSWSIRSAGSEETRSSVPSSSSTMRMPRYWAWFSPTCTLKSPRSTATTNTPTAEVSRLENAVRGAEIRGRDDLGTPMLGLVLTRGSQVAKREAGSTPLEILVPLIIAVSLALVNGTTKPTLALTLILGAFPLVVAFLSPLAGLYLLVFSMLLGPELLIGGMGSGATLGRGVTLRYDDFILLLVGVAWLARSVIVKQRPALLRTPL